MTVLPFHPARASIVFGALFVAALTTAGCGASRRKLDTVQPWEYATRAAEHPPTAIKVTVPSVAQEKPPDEIPDALREKVTLRSEAIDIRSLMLGLAKQTGLNITLDPDVSGQVSAYFNDVTVLDALKNIADQLGAEVDVKGSVVSVHRPRNEFRVFRLHYLRNPRAAADQTTIFDRALTPTGVQSAAQVFTATQSNLPGGIVLPTPVPGGGGHTEVVSAFASNFWEDLSAELQAIVFDGVKQEDLFRAGNDRRFAGIAITDQAGRSLVINSMAGTIQVRARRNVLDAIHDYLEAVDRTIQRQVVIDVRILEVSFSDGKLFGIETSNAPVLPSSMMGSSGLLQNIFGASTGAVGPPPTAITGSGGANTFTPSTNTFASLTTPLGFPSLSGSLNLNQAVGVTLPLTPNDSVYGISVYNDLTGQANNQFPFRILMQMLGQLGDVKVISAPRITALHNQKALLKVVRDRVFFSVRAGTVIAGTATTPTVVTAPDVTPVVVPEGVTLDLTPNIDDEGTVTLEIHPSFSVVVGEKAQPGGQGSQPEVERREFATTVRVQGEQTVVLGGLVSERTARVETGIPYLKDIPFLGALFRTTNEQTEKSELIMLLTPRVQGAKLLHEQINEFRALQGEGPMSEPASGSTSGKGQ